MSQLARSDAHRPRRVLLLGSGALQIGQAGEFDYSGAQALKALREENVFSVLVNPNIATVQTDPGSCDRVYLSPVLPEVVERIIIQERIDAILLSFGGQTALNCGLALEEDGVLSRYGVQILGTPIESIRDTEDRDRFVKRLNEIGVQTPRSIACASPTEVRAAAITIGLPIMLRAGYSLGGKGSGIVRSESALESALLRAFSGDVRQVLVEECLWGWKEIEYEVVRDSDDNCIAVCNMENMDPLGIHTGESIVVAPAQTLDDDDYQSLRTIALRAVRHLGVVGECNIQFALNPHNRDYRVIEVNARLSRSSALASKATGYPLAYIAAKLALGRRLSEIPNEITGQTTAFFEPALDYIVCKMPRWDLTKFHGAQKQIGSEMKSVGEVMAIALSFPEAVQKALRMLDIGVHGLDPEAYQFPDLEEELQHATPRRIFAIAQALSKGMSIELLHELTKIDPWFLHSLRPILQKDVLLRRTDLPLDEPTLVAVKALGFSDQAIDTLTGQKKGSARSRRLELGLRPALRSIDTTAAEFPAATNYSYLTYGAPGSDSNLPHGKKLLILGSGVYRIGSSVEFDWCCVSAAREASRLGYSTIMLNYNPETVSTDYDVCDELIFDEISLETVLEVCDLEKPDGVIVSMGGQIPNNLALRLAENGIPVLGTAPSAIDQAEDRQKFSSLLDSLNIDQPYWENVTNAGVAEETVTRLGGFPVLVRPSYVLSGAAMSLAHEPVELADILDRAKRVSKDHPVVVSKFETHAREIELDAVADRGIIVVYAISEHIENAGVHSGDATLVLPPQTVYLPTLRKIRQIAARLAQALSITGPFNLQFLAKQNTVKVIECNLRASRSFPFVSKVLDFNFAEEAVRRMLGVRTEVRVESLDLERVGVKVPMFSYARLRGVDPMLGIEMASTGEVGCIGDDLHDALLQALMATGFRIPRKGVLLSLGPLVDKYTFVEEAGRIQKELGLPLFATRGTAEVLMDLGIDCQVVEKTPDEGDAVKLLERGEVDLVVNVPRDYDSLGRPDGYRIRRQAVELGIPLIVDLKLARAIFEALRARPNGAIEVRAWQDYVGRPG